MLHFLIGLAVLLWITITLTYFIRGERERRMIARDMQRLYPVAQKPPRGRRGELDYFIYTVAAIVVAFIVIAASH
jgi:hypothetical protein